MLRAIRIRCQRPGCSSKTVLGLEHLDEISRRGGIARVANDVASSFMLLIGGWGYSIDLDGVLYAVCPVDVAAIQMSPEACG